MASDVTGAEGGFVCTRCEGEGRIPMGAPPFQNELGARIAETICSACWEEWKQRQMVIINHYGLNVREQKAREFLIANLNSFLFGEGEGEAEIDTGQEGSVSW
jgi:Fe-S cluster biosynthesis and repair protein YggX